MRKDDRAGEDPIVRRAALRRRGLAALRIGLQVTIPEGHPYQGDAAAGVGDMEGDEHAGRRVGRVDRGRANENPTRDGAVVSARTGTGAMMTRPAASTSPEVARHATLRARFHAHGRPFGTIRAPLESELK